MLADWPVPHRVPLAPVFEWLVPSSRYSDTAYHVCLMMDGSWTCECAAYNHGSRADGECRHIDEGRAEREHRMTLAFLLC